MECPLLRLFARGSPRINLAPSISRRQDLLAALSQRPKDRIPSHVVSSTMQWHSNSRSLGRSTRQSFALTFKNLSDTLWTGIHVPNLLSANAQVSPAHGQDGNFCTHTLSVLSLPRQCPVRSRVDHTGVFPASNRLPASPLHRECTRSGDPSSASFFLRVLGRLVLWSLPNTPYLLARSDT